MLDAPKIQGSLGFKSKSLVQLPALDSSSFIKPVENASTGDNSQRNLELGNVETLRNTT